MTDAFFRQAASRHPFTGPILEVGAGRDRTVRKLFGRRHKVVAVNIYPQNVVDAIASVTCLPYKDASFGCVVCEHVLEHVEEPAKAIAEMRRVLKPNGLLILIVPFSWPVHEKPFDLWRFTEEGLRVLLTPSFEKLDFTPLGGIPSKPRLIAVTARKAAPARTGEAPKVSIIMPTYNRARMIGRSIQSILDQTFQDWELIIVSDGSTDNTPEVVSRFKDPRIRFFHQKNGGPASARNHGLRRARGRYIAYCDDDDTLLPYHLETLSGYLDRHPEAGWVRGSALGLKAGKEYGHRMRGFLWASMHRYSLFKRTGFFDKKLLIFEDYDFMLKASDHYPAVALPLIVCVHRMCAQGIFISQGDRSQEILDRIYRRRLRKIFAGTKIDSRHYLMMANILYRSHTPGALLELGRLFQRHHPGIESSFLSGLSYYWKGAVSKAIDCMKRVAADQARFPGDESVFGFDYREIAYLFLSSVYHQRRAPGASREYLGRGLRSYPDSLLLRLEHLYRHGPLRTKSRDRTQQLVRSFIDYQKVLSQGKGDRARKILKRIDCQDALPYHFYWLAADFCEKADRPRVAEIYRRKGRSLQDEAFFSSLLRKRILRFDRAYWGKEIAPKIFLPKVLPGPSIISAQTVP